MFKKAETTDVRYDYFNKIYVVLSIHWETAQNMLLIFKPQWSNTIL